MRKKWMIRARLSLHISWKMGNAAFYAAFLFAEKLNYKLKKG